MVDSVVNEVPVAEPVKVHKTPEQKAAHEVKVERRAEKGVTFAVVDRGTKFYASVLEAQANSAIPNGIVVRSRALHDEVVA